MPKDLCGAQQETEDGDVLTCTLPAGHAGPVHRDADGVAWGDMALVVPDDEI